MADFEVVESFETSYNLHKKVPNLFLVELCSILLRFLDQLEQVAIVSMFHYDAKVSRGTLEECVLIPDNVWVLDGSQNSDFVQGVLFFFLRKFTHLNFFHSIHSAI